MDIEIPLKEMISAKATHVSLVPRGANTMPFKKLAAASEPGGIPMLNIREGLKKTFNIEDPKPEVLAIAVKGNPDDKMIAHIGALGFSTENKQHIEGATIFIQKDAELGGEGQIAVQMDESVAVICSFNPFPESDDFKVNIDQQGFLPGFDVALSVLRDTVFNALFDADAPEEAVEKISKAVKSFGSHMKGMAKALPTAAFKMDPAIKSLNKETLEKIAKTLEVDVKVLVDGAPTAAEVGRSPSEAEFNSADGVDTGSPKAVSDSGNKRTMKSEDEPVEISIGGKTIKLTAEAAEQILKDNSEVDTTEGDVTGLEAKAEGSPDDNGDTVVKSEGEDPMDAFKSMLNEVVSPVVDQIKDVVEKVNTLSERVETAEKAVQKADQVLGRTILGGSDEDSEEKFKADAADDYPLIDTGMERIRLASA